MLGNVMMDDKFEPVIIDFGHASLELGDSNPYIEEDFPTIGTTYKFTDDKTKVVDMLKQLQIKLLTLNK